MGGRWQIMAFGRSNSPWFCVQRTIVSTVFPERKRCFPSGETMYSLRENDITPIGNDASLLSTGIEGTATCHPSATTSNRLEHRPFQSRVAGGR